MKRALAFQKLCNTRSEGVVECRRGFYHLAVSSDALVNVDRQVSLLLLSTFSKNYKFFSHFLFPCGYSEKGDLKCQTPCVSKFVILVLLMQVL